MNVNALLITASVITALTVIFTFIVKAYVFARNLEKKYEDIDSMLKTNALHILKLAVLNDNLPLTDRINAGEQYIKLGGNGFIKKKYEHLLDEYEQNNSKDRCL